jgi:hypothetical protein
VTSEEWCAFLTQECEAREAQHPGSDPPHLLRGCRVLKVAQQWKVEHLGKGIHWLHDLLYTLWWANPPLPLLHTLPMHTQPPQLF